MGPLPAVWRETGFEMLALTVQRCPIGNRSPIERGYVTERSRVAVAVKPLRKVGQVIDLIPICGGDPAADSPTATLLRLKPPCEAQIRSPLRRPHPDLTRVL